METAGWPFHVSRLNRLEQKSQLAQLHSAALFFFWYPDEIWDIIRIMGDVVGFLKESSSHNST